MPLYIIKAPVKHGGKLRRTGEIELPERQAAPLVSSGFLALPHATTTESVKGKAPAAGSSAAGAEPNGSGALTQTKAGAAEKAKAPKAAAGKSAKPSAPKPQAKPAVTGEK